MTVILLCGSSQIQFTFIWNLWGGGGRIHPGAKNLPPMPHPSPPIAPLLLLLDLGDEMTVIINIRETRARQLAASLRVSFCPPCSLLRACRPVCCSGGRPNYLHITATSVQTTYLDKRHGSLGRLHTLEAALWWLESVKWTGATLGFLRSPPQDSRHPYPTQPSNNYMKMDFSHKITSVHYVCKSSGFGGPRFGTWPFLCLWRTVWPKVSYWRSLGLVPPLLNEAKGACPTSPSCCEDYSWNFICSVDYHLWLFAGG